MATNPARPGRPWRQQRSLAQTLQVLLLTTEAMFPELVHVEVEQLLRAIGSGLSSRSIGAMSGLPPGWILAAMLTRNRLLAAAFPDPND